MTATTTLSTEPDAREAERPSRVRTLLLLVSLLDRLPAPQEISFTLAHPDSLWIELDSVEDFDEWAELLNARVDSRDKLIASGGSVQSHATADWNGWRVYLQVIVLVPDTERLTADEAASVLEKPERTLTAPERAVEAHTSDPAPIPATLHCPRCSHTEYASEDDPDAGLGQMHNHILWEHADRNPDVTLQLLAQVRSEEADDDE